MKSKYAGKSPTPETSAVKRELIPYRGHPDWKGWLAANHTKFADGRIKAKDPSFYSFLVYHKVRQEAQDYLTSKGYNPPVRTVKKHIINREEFIRKINEIKADKGQPDLIIIERDLERLEKLVNSDD